MAKLSGILAAKRRTESKPKKVHPAASKVFSAYELANMKLVDYEKGDKYDRVYNPQKYRTIDNVVGGFEYTPPRPTKDNPNPKTRQQVFDERMKNWQPGRPMIGDRDSQEIRFNRPQMPEADKAFLDKTLDDYRRWQKTGSRFPAVETSITRRKKYMGKRFTGNMQGFSGVTGKASIKKKKLLGA